jgi:MEDS: MEthanogen/methylotroph, DcmR Sensory domain
MHQTTVFQQDSDCASMVAEIGRIMSATLNQGDAVVCIASGVQRRLFERQMKTRGVDVVRALMRGQLICLNALDTLTKIMVDGLPDLIRFAEVVGATVDRAAVRYPRVLMFGDFSGLQHSNAARVVELDALWQALVASRPEFVRCPQRAAVRQEDNRRVNRFGS